MRSENKYDVHLWVLKVIKSCTTWRHIKSAMALRDVFYELHDDSLLYNEQNRAIGKMETSIDKNFQPEF
jgi:hypothetical protein